MTQAGPEAVGALVTHARRVPASERQQFAARLRAESAGQPLVLDTCHRTEAYLVSADDDAARAEWLPVGGRAILIVDAGTMGRLAVHAATAAGASVWVANRSPGRQERAARELFGL